MGGTVGGDRQTPAGGLKMNSEIRTKLASLYETDYQGWLDQTVKLLQSHDFDSLDLGNLIEEIESLGKSEKRAISSYLMRLCEHLLKMKYWESQRETNFRGWKLEIRNFRLQIQAILNDSPSLKNYLNANFAAAYRNGRNLFLDGSEVDRALIPEEPWFTLEQALDEDWLPWQPN
jgi:hypothetical protein